MSVAEGRFSLKLPRELLARPTGESAYSTVASSRRGNPLQLLVVVEPGSSRRHLAEDLAVGGGTAT